MAWIFEPIEFTAGFVTGILDCANRKNMPRILDPVRFVLIALAGWMNQHQQQTIEYVREENRVRE